MYDEIMASLILFSKTTQPTVINSQIIFHTMLSYLNAAIVKIPFCLRVMGFSNNHLLFLFSWGRGFSTDNSDTGEPSTLHQEQKISGEEMHTPITFMVSVMASNTVDSL